jgi:hypothetical protein
MLMDIPLGFLLDNETNFSDPNAFLFHGWISVYAVILSQFTDRGLSSRGRRRMLR